MKTEFQQTYELSYMDGNTDADDHTYIFPPSLMNKTTPKIGAE